MDTDKRLRAIGINIKSERIRKNLSQDDLALACGLSRNSLSLVETGKLNPTVFKIIDIAKRLEIDIKVILKDI